MAVSNSLRANGFECEFVEQLPEAFQTECPICLLILREPYQAVCCGQSFCRSCIENIKASKNLCPHCNTRNFNDYPNKSLQQSLNKLKVYCTHQNKGCEWTGQLGELDNHLNLDPQLTNQLKGCVFVVVKCTYCSEPHQRQHINHHQQKACLKRPFTCEHCKIHKSTFEDITNNHWPVCRCYPVECPNKCGAVIQRQNVKKLHVAKDCPLTVIGCEFHYAGCEVKLPRKDMGEHLRVELVKHTSMMAISKQADQKRMNELMMKQLLLLAKENETKTKENEEKIEELERDSQEKSVQMDQLVKENEVKSMQIAKLAKENHTLKEKVIKLEMEQEKLFKAACKIPPAYIVMPDFKYYWERKVAWFSPPFYSHERGYKLCLRLFYLLEQKLSVGVHLMRGEFDDELKWPLKGEVTIQLLRQDGSDRHHTKTISLYDRQFYSRVTERDRSWNGNGELEFVSIKECQKRYTDVDGCLHFRIVNVEQIEVEPENNVLECSLDDEVLYS